MKSVSVVLLLTLTMSMVAKADHAVILLYHHVSDQTPASTSVTPARFERHLDYLEDNEFEVWPLARIFDQLLEKNGEVPDNVVGISFDDAYESVYTEALPRLAKRGWPFTVFVNTDAVDAGHEPYLDWDRLRDLEDNGVAIENHSATHGHLLRREPDESEAEWRKRIHADIGKAHARIEEEIGRAPRLFAYPYGEDSEALAAIVDEFYEHALVQRSGAVGPETDSLAIPRFPMATGFDSIERFKLAVNTRPLPVRQASPEPPGDGIREPVRALKLKLTSDGYHIGRLSCFSGNGKRLELDIDEGSPITVHVDAAGTGLPGRNRINCTAPAADDSGDFYWYSYQWVQGSR